MKHGRQFAKSIIPKEGAWLFDKPYNYTNSHTDVRQRMTPMIVDAVKSYHQFVLVGVAEIFTLGWRGLSLASRPEPTQKNTTAQPRGTRYSEQRRRVSVVTRRDMSGGNGEKTDAAEREKKKQQSWIENILFFFLLLPKGWWTEVIVPRRRVSHFILLLCWPFFLTNNLS